MSLRVFCFCLVLLLAVNTRPNSHTQDSTAIMLGADKKAMEEDIIDLTEEDEVMDEKAEEEDDTEAKEDEKDEKGEPTRYSIVGRIPAIRRLMYDVDTTGIKLVADGRRAPNVCVLSRYSDETLRGLWNEVKDNHTPLETEQHRARGTSACWIWNVVNGISGLENGYPVITIRRTLSKTVKMPYVKIHQLAAYIRTGKRTGLGKGAATVEAPPGSRKKSWVLVASHLCHNKQCIRPDHIWPEANGWNADRGKCRGPGPCACKGHVVGGQSCLLYYRG